MPRRKHNRITNELCGNFPIQESKQTLIQDYNQQIDIERLLKLLLKTQLITANHRRITTEKVLDVIQHNRFSKLRLSDGELGSLLYGSGYLDQLSKCYLTFSLEKVRALQTSQSLGNEMEQFLLILVEAGLLSETNLVIKKEELRICLLKNRKRLPHITQYQLGHELLSRGFVEPISGPGTFKVSKQKLEALLESREHDSNENHDEMLISDINTQIELEKFVQILVDSNLLSLSQLTIRRQSVREMLRANQFCVPTVTHYQLGLNLMKYGYLDRKADNVIGTFAFKAQKIRSLVDKTDQKSREMGFHDEQESSQIKDRQLEQLLHILIAENILTKRQNIVGKETVRRILYENCRELSQTSFNGVGSDLKKFGFIEPNSPKGTYTFYSDQIHAAMIARDEGAAMLGFGSGQRQSEQQENIPQNVSSPTQQQQADILVGLLVKAKFLTKSHYIVPKDVVREICMFNIRLFPNLPINGRQRRGLGYTLMMAGYLDYETSPDTYTFHQSKLCKIIDEINDEDVSHRNSNPPARRSSQLDPMSEDKKHKDLEVLVNLLIDYNILSEENTIAKKELVRGVAHENKRFMPHVNPTELGYTLQSYGFIEHKSATGTYSFSKRKLRYVFANRNTRNERQREHNEQLQYSNGLDDFSAWKIERNVTFARPKNDGFTLSSKSCCVCRKNFLIEMHLEEHMTNVHGSDFVIPQQLTMGSSFLGIFEMKLVEPSSKDLANVTFLVQNIYGKTVQINKVYYIYSNQFVSLTGHANKSSKIEPGGTYEFTINREFFISDEKRHSVILFFEDEKEYIEHYYIMTSKSLCHRGTDAVTECRDATVTRKVFNPIRPFKLKEYKPMREVIKLFNHGFKHDASFTDKETHICNTVRNFVLNDSDTRLTSDNYVEIMSYVIQIADCGQERSMMAFDKENQRLSVKTKGYYSINLNDINGLPDELTEGDYIQLRKTRNNGRFLDTAQDKVLALIYKFEGDHIIVEIVDDGHVDVNAQYNVRFKGNRIPVKMEHQALEVFEKQKLSAFMFPTSVPEANIEITEFDWFNKSIRSNPEQVQAIKYIVNGTAKPAPYIVFGPPGTGKTSTIVEAICQLWKVFDTSKILVTAQSNAACNEIIERLIKFLPTTDVYRLFAPSLEKKLDTIAKELIPISNLASGRHQYPGWADFYQFRVVVCTLCTAGRLVQAEIKTTHFTHVFIDECASATEPSALIPIAGLVTSAKQVNGQIILAGDIKQLGPVVKTPFAEKMGYAIPMMERLMNLPLYQKNPATCRYNPNVITKLIRSFRSHPKIIEFSNEAFYDGDLLAKALPLSTHWALNWSHLPNGNFPMLFLPCFGETKRDKNSFSSYNLQEIDKIERYVRILLSTGINKRPVCQSDIGIISPYKRQCSKLMLRFGDNHWNDIEVGTVETYQGREKPVIIISTVRSGGDNVGFLNNPKRLNVSITRAQALMILIGNPDTLKNDPNWYDLLRYICNNGGCSEPIMLGKRPVTRLSTSMENLMDEFNMVAIKPPAVNQNVTIDDFF